MPNAPLEGITDGEQLFRKIIEPYKGKVIYLDIWGTWCGPCKDMMQYAGNIKNLFAGKEVVFLYLCNHSTDKSWKNIIKEYGLTSKSSVHYNLPDKQQSAIEKYLGVHSFPTYMLIDKEGNIVNRKAPRPTMENQLLNAVSKELEKKEVLTSSANIHIRNDNTNIYVYHNILFATVSAPDYPQQKLPVVRRRSRSE